MTKQTYLIILMTMFLISCQPQEKKEWRKETLQYTKAFLKNHNSNSRFDLGNLKTTILKVDNDSLILAMHSNKVIEKQAMTYYFIDPKQNLIICESTITVNGCKLDIPSYLIMDINNDGNDDFIFLELYDKDCEGNFWISSNFKEIRPKTFGSDIDYYLKLKNDTRINKKIEIINYDILQKILNESIDEIFK